MAHIEEIIVHGEPTFAIKHDDVYFIYAYRFATTAATVAAKLSDGPTSTGDRDCNWRQYPQIISERLMD